MPIIASAVAELALFFSFAEVHAQTRNPTQSFSAVVKYVTDGDTLGRITTSVRWGLMASKKWQQGKQDVASGQVVRPSSRNYFANGLSATSRAISIFRDRNLLKRHALTVNQ
jgi:hypothetical protein